LKIKTRSLNDRCVELRERTLTTAGAVTMLEDPRRRRGGFLSFEPVHTKRDVQVMLRGGDVTIDAE
jgi:hypothetical protein